jgi:predicted TIM-barrel fold metal-dependent hydrolase
MTTPPLSRRAFLLSTAACAVGCRRNASPGTQPVGTTRATYAPTPVIDIHQHTNYSGRPDDVLLAHQQRMGVTKSILLPAGTPVSRPSTHDGKSNGLAAQTGGNESCYRIVKEHPGRYAFFANEVTDLEDAPQAIEKYLKLGAVGIGEQKFNVECDSPESRRLYALAADYGVPVLLHFQHGEYNKGFERFHLMLEKHPKTNFIGHAQTWWSNIDRDHKDPTILYPKTRVTPGGLTDRYLGDYPNMFGDMSAGSGLNSMMRDEDHARAFLARHQDKLLYGSDCNDRAGTGPTCQGWMTIQTINRLAPDDVAKRKILYENSARMFRLG